jgi:hypothetical protein
LETVVERDCRDVDGIKAATLMVIEEFIERWEVFTVLRPKWIRTPTTHCGEDSLLFSMVLAVSQGLSAAASSSILPSSSDLDGRGRANTL